MSKQNEQHDRLPLTISLNGIRIQSIAHKDSEV